MDNKAETSGLLAWEIGDKAKATESVREFGQVETKSVKAKVDSRENQRLKKITAIVHGWVIVWRANQAV